MLTRDRNKVKFKKWHFYLASKEGSKNREIVRKLRTTCRTTTGRVPGSKNVPLQMEKLTNACVQIEWPMPCTVDGCTRVLRMAIGNDWRRFVTDPVGAQGTAATAEEQEAREDAVVPATSAASAPPAAAAPGASSSGATPAEEHALLALDDRHNLLALTLEMCIQLYKAKDATDTYETPPNPYKLDWGAELGQGTFGKVYLGKLSSPGGDVSRMCAIKLLRDAKEDEALGFNSNATKAADEEVRRHVALGHHPNVVRLLDVGFFTRLHSKRRVGYKSLQQWTERNWTWENHLGLVFDLFEMDVRQFLQSCAFTQTGVRHVVNSTLAGLGFLHDRGCVHCDFKPANVFLRGSPTTRGCFEKQVLAQRQIGEWDPVHAPHQSRLEFLYQIPRSFEALGSI